MRPSLSVDSAHATFYRQTMDLHLSARQESRVLEALRSGAYQSPDEVIDRALEVLREQDEWLLANRDAINAKVHRAIAELDR